MIVLKKLFAFTIIFLIAGYILYQNWSLWLLRIVSLGSSSPQSFSNVSSSSLTPPYKDGTYTGNPADAIYGTIQVKAIIQNGKITDVQFLQYPSDRSRSIAINTLAMPNLTQEAIQVQ